MTDQIPDISDLTTVARTASLSLAVATAGVKNRALEAIATALEERSREILSANQLDLVRGRENDMSAGLLDRLALDQSRITSIADSVREVASLPDPVGEIVRGTVNELGLRIRQVRVPMGVVAVIYEARPNVTIDATALALKSGNAVILRGGSAAFNSNQAIITVMRDALESVDLPADLVQTVDHLGRPGVTALMRARGGIDVLIPRGGAGLIQAVVENSIVPVIETGTGNCHVYVDEGADLEVAERIIMNAKTQRVGVCNAAETLLVHEAEAERFLLSALTRLATAGVTLHLDPASAQIARQTPSIDSDMWVEATEEDWATEYLSMDLAVRVVPSIDEAIAHIRRYSTGHTEAICTRSLQSANRFQTEIDSAAIAVNASTRFTDGGQVGLGAEIGISTQKLHARGPMGLAELTTTRWIIEGDGTVRP